MTKLTKPQLTLTATDIRTALSVRHSDDYFITEVKNGPSWFANDLRIIDALAVKRSWAQPLISAYEIKVSKGDFKADNKWPAYLPFCDCFSFACPKGLISKDEIAAISQHHPGVGLIYVNENLKCWTAIKPLNRQVPQNPDLLMYIIMSKLESDRYPFHSSKLDYFREWLDNKHAKESIGIRVGGRMAEVIREQQEEIKALKNAEWQAKQLKPDERLTEVVESLNQWQVDKLVEILKTFDRPSDLLDVIKAARDIAKVYNNSP